MNFCPHRRRKELYLCTSLWPPPPLPPPYLPKLNVLYSLYRQCVSERGGGGGGELCCRPYSAGILHSVSDQMQNLPNYFITPHKMTSENDIKGLVSLKFLRPCFYQCSGSMTFWGGSGSGSSDPCFWLMDLDSDPDPDPDPGSGSCYFRHWPSRCQQKTNF